MRPGVLSERPASPWQGEPAQSTHTPAVRRETLRGDFDLAHYSAELLDPESWGEILSRFAYTMRMAVALTDVHGRLLGPCYNPQPVWSLARKAMVESGGTESSAACPFCLAPQTACSGVSDALIHGKITYLTDAAGLSHAAIPLFLGDQPLGGLIAGQTFARYPQPLALQRIARRFGASQQDLWNAAVHQMPVSRVTLGLYGDLLETLGHAFVRERYAGILDRQLQETNQRYRLMIEGANDRALFTVDGSGTVISWNSGAEKLLGYAKSEIPGRNYSDFFVTEDIRSGIPIRAIRLAEQTGWTEQEHWQVRKDGTRFLSEIVIARLGEGENVEYGTLLHDVTEQRRATEAAVQAQKLESIGVLAGGIAHDFNNLLTGILGSLSLAMENLPPDDAARPLLSIAEQASLRAAELIAQLLAYAGKGASVVAPFDLSDLITKILPLIDTSIPKTVQLELSLAPNLPWINADSSEIQQVIMNLVINGAEAFGPEVEFCGFQPAWRIVSPIVRANPAFTSKFRIQVAGWTRLRKRGSSSHSSLRNSPVADGPVRGRGHHPAAKEGWRWKARPGVGSTFAPFFQGNRLN